MNALASASIQRQVFIAAMACVVIEGVDLQVVGLAAPAIVSDWQVTKAQFAPAMAASLLGMAIGAPASGRMADRLGRRPLIVGCLAMLGVLTACTAAAANVHQIALLRLAAGLCFGAILTNAPVLAGEWSDRATQDRTVSRVVIGTPVGGMLGAAAFSWVIPHWGWQMAFLASGAITVLTAGLVWGVMLESPVFAHARAVRQTQRTAAPSIFQPPYRRSTAGIGLAFLTNLAVSYAFFSWEPTFLSALGVPMERAIRALFWFNLCGSLVAVVAAALMSRVGLKPYLLGFAALGVLSLVGLMTLLDVRAGALMSSPSWLIGGSTLVGVATIASQAGLYALANRIYPISCRATGMGVAGGAGRCGGLLSSYLGGIVLSSPSGSTLFVGLNALLFCGTAAGVLLVDRILEES